MSFEQVFKNIDDILRLEVPTALDYTEQSSWILFLRYLDELEQDKSDEAELRGETYEYILDEEYRWSKWAMPKDVDGKVILNAALTGPDLIQFVDHKLFPYLASFREKTDNPNTIEYKVGEIFYEVKNKIRSGYNLREILEAADKLPFRTSDDKHELSALYEEKIKAMGNAGRNGGEYYTPRPLIRAMIKVVDPKIGETIYDAAAGSCGFLCEAYEYLLPKKKNTDDIKTLQEKTFYGKEKKSLAYVIGIMNMILHGIEAPNLVHTNTLGENIRDIQEKDRYNVILANPPFGGKERPEVQQNFDIKTSETAYLFMQHFIKSLKTSGRSAIVIKNTVLSNTDNASVSLRKHLLESCNVHTILDMPGGTFIGAGVKTVVLFFDKGEPTKNIWYYQLNPGRNMGKTNPLNDADLEEFVQLQGSAPETEKSWNIKFADIDKTTYDLSVKNPNLPEGTPLLTPDELLINISELSNESNNLLRNIEILYHTKLNVILSKNKQGWKKKKLGDVCKIIGGGTPSKANQKFYEGHILWATVRDMKDDIIIDTEHKITEEAVLKSSTNIIPKGNVIIATRVGLGKVCLTAADTAINQDLRGVIPSNTKELSVSYLYHWFKSISQKIIDEGTGATVQGVKLPFIKSLEIDIPPIEIQQLIVSELDLISSESEKLQSVFQSKINEIIDFKKSVLQKSFVGELSSKDSVINQKTITI